MDRSRKLAELSGAAEKRTAEGLLEYLTELFGDGIALASSFGAEDQVLTDMIAKAGKKIRIFTLDTGRLNQETYDLIEKTRRKYDIQIETYFPDYRQLEKMLTEHGPNLFYKNVEFRKLCCGIRKIEPLKRALAGLDAWICGLRADQSTTRTGLKQVDFDENFGIIKVSPLAGWSTEQVWEYIRDNNVPYNSLHDEGYPSIGCEPCTRAVEAGQDIRAGRWWWEEPEKKECGLHLNEANNRRIK